MTARPFGPRFALRRRGRGAETPDRPAPHVGALFAALIAALAAILVAALSRAEATGRILIVAPQAAAHATQPDLPTAAAAAIVE